MHQKKWEESKKFLSKAIQCGEEGNDVRYLIAALISMGDFYRIQDRIDDAIPLYRRVTELSKKFNFREREYEAWYRLAQCYEKKD